MVPLNRTAGLLPGTAARVCRILLCGMLAGASALSAAQTASIPAPKLELIRQAMAAMRLDQKIQALVAQRVEAKVRDVRLEYPELEDGQAAGIRAAVAGIYAENMEGHDGLLPRVHAVFDRNLTEEDLRFAVNFRGSDEGRRYRTIAPRVVNESLEAGRAWAERLEPEVARRVEDELRGQGVNF